MPTSIPTTKEKVPAHKMPGAWGFYEENSEREVNEGLVNNLSLENLLNLPEHNLPERRILGSIPFNSAAEAAINTALDLGKETVVDAFDLLKTIAGVEEKTPIPDVFTEAFKQNDPNLSEEEKRQIQEKKNAQQIQFRVDWFKELANAQSQEETENLMKEALRITGRMVSEEEAPNLGVARQDVLKVATFHTIAENQQEATEEAADQQKTIETASIAPKVVGTYELINNEGSSKFTGPNAPTG